VLIFTPIFELKTNMSYNLYPLYIANQPIFKVFRKKPLIFNFFYLFIILFNSAISLLPCALEFSRRLPAICVAGSCGGFGKVAGTATPCG